MLNILRKRAQSIVIQVVVLVIAIVFVFWGVGSNLGNKRNSLATVNGEEISFNDYQKIYDSTIDNYRVQFGGSIPQGFLEALGLKQQVLNQLVQAAVFRQSGREMGITVSKVATQDEIKKMEVFQTNGQFDLNLYQNVLSQNRMNPKSFEASLRNDLLTKRVSESIRGFSAVTDSEVQSRIDFNNEEIKLAYAEVKSADFLDKVEIQEPELARWYEENKNNYLSEPQIRLKYLYFGFDDNLDQIEIDENALRSRYETQMDRYNIPEQRQARHILFKVEETDDVQVREDKKKKADEVLLLAQQGDDFTELAKKYSEGPSGPGGGDLGFFGRGAMVPTFDEAVFQLQPGEISGIVETQFGYHIIKLEEVREGQTRSYDEVKEEIADAIRQDDVKKFTFNRATRAYEDIIRSGSLEKYKTQSEGIVQETDYFSQKTPPGPPVSEPQLLQKAFSLKKGELSSLIETDSGYAILFMDDIRDPEVREFDAVREKVVEHYTQVKSVDLAREKAEQLLKDSQENKGLAQAAGDSAVLQKSDFIRRSAASTGKELPAQIIQKAFELSLQKPLPEEPFVQGDSFFVYELLEKRNGEEALDDSQKEQLREQLASASQDKLLSAWLTSMQDSADIWTNIQLLQ